MPNVFLQNPSKKIEKALEHKSFSLKNNAWIYGKMVNLKSCFLKVKPFKNSLKC